LQCGASSSIIENQKIQTFALILPILSIWYMHICA
jgi:hypothetical protein